MKNLVIGCGYLGKRVATLWRGRGDTVFVTTRSARRVPEFRQAGFESIICDVLAPETLKSLPTVDSVLFSVGLDRSSGQSMHELYVNGLENVLQSLPPPRHFIYVSSTGVYGQSAGEAVDENAATEPADDSGRTVLEAEQRLRSRRPEAVILRFAGIYGPGRLIRAEAVRSGQPIAGDPQKLLNLIHVEDGATAVLAAEGRGGLGQVYNVSDGAPVRRKDYYGYLAQLLNAPPPCFAPPADDESQRRRSRANRCILNERLHRELGVHLSYPTYKDGLPACLAAEAV